MSGVRNMAKGLATLAKLKSSMRELPLRVRTAVAKGGAPAITRDMRGAFESGLTVYGDARPLGVDGKPLTLVKSGRTQAALKFVAVGTILRAQLGTAYARYLIGKYRIMPQSKRLPAPWQAALTSLVSDHVTAFQREVAP